MSESLLQCGWEDTLPIDTLLIPMVEIFARNLVNDGGNGGRVCDPVESSSMATWFGADRVIAVCFEPASWFAPGRHATLYGIYKKDVALVYLAVLREKESQINGDSTLLGFLRFQ
ncbi:MAG: hypothetical protein JKY56_02300 [Kofleriaceae bacterium]|nr:hypothetical protein [Kofleriaceae bacterium]